MWPASFYINFLSLFQHQNSNRELSFLNSSLNSKLEFLNVGDFMLHFKLSKIGIFECCSNWTSQFFQINERDAKLDCLKFTLVSISKYLPIHQKTWKKCSCCLRNKRMLFDLPKANRMFWQKKHLKEHCHIYDGALCDKRLQLHPAITCVTNSSIVDMGEFVRYTSFSSNWKCHDWYTLIYCYVCKMSNKNWPPLRMCMRPFENKSKFLDQSSFSFRLRTFLK